MELPFCKRLFGLISEMRFLKEKLSEDFNTNLSKQF
jgi:hypothetical protein